MPRLLLLAILALLLGAAPAAADHRHDWDDEEYPAAVEEDSWDESDEEPWDEPPAEEPAAPPPPAAEPPVAPPVPDEWPGDDEAEEDPWEEPEIPLVTTATVRGTVAMLRTNGKAAIPRGAPKRVRAILAAGNQIVGKPYKWGGGHARLIDRGYDCSGTVSYALIRSGTGLLSSPLVSGSFARWGAAGAGRWVTVFANRGHVYLEVAGLRLDTSAVSDPRGGKGPRWRPAIGRRRGFRARHPLGL